MVDVISRTVFLGIGEIGWLVHGDLQGGKVRIKQDRAWESRLWQAGNAVVCLKGNITETQFTSLPHQNTIATISSLFSLSSPPLKLRCRLFRHRIQYPLHPHS